MFIDADTVRTYILKSAHALDIRSEEEHSISYIKIEVDDKVDRHE